MREEREAFRMEREQADATFRADRSESAATHERLKAGTENLRASMEQIQWRVRRQSRMARVKRLAGLGFVGGFEGSYLPRRAAGSGFLPAELQSPRSSASGDSGAV